MKTRHFFRSAVTVGLIILVAVSLDFLGFGNPYFHWILEKRMEHFQRPASQSIVLVEIDRKSIDGISSWPWKRSVHAKLVDRLNALQVEEIALDIDFSNPSTEIEDAELEDAIARNAGSVLLANFLEQILEHDELKTSLREPIERFRKHAWTANVNVRTDGDGLVRTYPYGISIDGNIVPSMGATLGGGMGIAGSEFLIDYSINSEGIDRVSVIDVLNGVVDPNRLAGKKIIVGASATELNDFFNVPVAGNVTGATLQALAAETILQNRILSVQNKKITLAGILLIALCAIFIGKVRWHLAVSLALSAGILIELAAAVIQSKTTIAVDTTAWQITLVCLALAAMVREIGIYQILHRIWHVRADNAELILSKVVADNFAGILIIDEDRTIRKCSRSAQLILEKNFSAEVPANTVLPAAICDLIDKAFENRRIMEPQLVGETTVEISQQFTKTLQYVATRSIIEDDQSLKSGKKSNQYVVCLTFTDVTEQRLAEEKIQRLALYDTLTDLPNRNSFIERLQSEIQWNADAPASAAIIYFDLDGFKNVNDTLGHSTGDRLLRAVAERAAGYLPDGADIARFGGDEFAVLVGGPDALNNAEICARTIIDGLAKPFLIGDHALIIGASAGIALISADIFKPDDVLMRADIALYRAKAEGGGRVRKFSAEMLEEIAERQIFERELMKAYKLGQFEVWYQPQFDIVSGRLCGAEALLRWRHPERGIISPEKFIPVAETIGMIKELGQWVLETACSQAAAWPGRVKLAVNVSSVQFARCDVAEVLATAMQNSGISPDQLDLEITESLFMQPNDRLLDTLTKIRDFGVGLALDDFGTGYSSLGYVHKFPITKIKIDRSFVVGLPKDAEAAAIVRAVATLAKNMNIRLNAEGIETREQVQFLKSIGVEEGQGFIWGEPQTEREFSKLLTEIGVAERLLA